MTDVSIIGSTTNMGNHNDHKSESTRPMNNKVTPFGSGCDTEVPVVGPTVRI